MWKLKLIKNQYQIETEPGKMLSTYHAQNGIVPMTWDPKHNKPEKIKETAKEFWGQDLDISLI